MLIDKLKALRDVYVYVYDNEGSTFDRYLAVYRDQEAGYSTNLNPSFEARRMSFDPTHPAGFNQMTEATVGGHNGILISFSDLPEKCQMVVLKDRELI